MYNHKYVWGNKYIVGQNMRIMSGDFSEVESKGGSPENVLPFS